MSVVNILEINGTERELRTGTMNCQLVINGRDVFSCEVLSDGGAYRPALGDTLKWKEDGTYKFGGLIELVEETGADGQPIDDIANRVTAVAYNVYFERRHITETFTAGMTVADVATVLVNNYLDDYGVTLDPSQATGDTLTADLVVDGEKLSEFLDRFTTATGYYAKIDPAKQFRMFTAGDVAAPVNVVDGDGHHVGDIRVTRIRESQRPNTIIIKYGPNGNLDLTDTFTGDGSTDTFDLSAPIVGPLITTVDGAVGRGYVDHLGTESLGGLSSGQTWLYDPSADPPTIQRSSGPPAVSASISVAYTAQFPQVVTVTDDADITLNGPIEAVYVYDTVTSKAEAQVLGAALLARGQADKTEVTYQTYEIGLEPGQTQTITAADRNVSGSFLITEVNATNDANTQDVLRTVRAVLGTTFTGSFRDVYNDWLRMGGGSTSTAGPQLSMTRPGADLLVAIKRLGNAAIKAAADTPVLVVPPPPVAALGSPGNAQRIKVIACSLRLRTTGGAYTNIDTDLAGIDLICGGARMSSGYYNDSVASVSKFSDLFGASHDLIADIPVPAMDAIEGFVSSPQGSPQTDQYVMGEDIASLPDSDDLAQAGVYLMLRNNNAGAFTGGGTGNGLKCTVYYVLEDMEDDWSETVTVQAGSLAFSGFGDAAMKFYSPTGAALSAPSSNPWIGTSGGSGGCQGILALDDGKIVVTGGGYPGPNFESSLALSSDFSSILGFDTTLMRSIASDYTDNFYGLDVNASPTTSLIFKFANDGTKASEWDIGVLTAGTYALGMQPDESVAYLARISSAVSTVSQVNLGTLVTSTFVTRANYQISAVNAILVLRSGDVLVGWESTTGGTGDVVRYNAAGVVQATYALTGGSASPVQLTPGLDDTSFWCGYYNDAASGTSSGVTWSRIRVSDGAVLNTFDPDSGSFEFDGPACVIRQDIA